MVRQIKKIKTKKREKAKADVLTLTQKLLNFVGKNIQAFMYLIVALFIIGAAIGGFWYVRAQSEKKAAERFYNALMVYWQGEEVQKTGGNKYSKALQILQSIMHEYPNTKYANWCSVYIGNCNLYLRNYSRAIEAYGRYIREGKGRDLFTVDAYRGLGVAYIEEGKYSEAIKVYKDFIKKGEKSLNDTFLWNIGWCYEKMGDEKNAKEFYKKILDEYPNSFHRRDAERKIKIFELVS